MTFSSSWTPFARASTSLRTFPDRLRLDFSGPQRRHSDVGHECDDLLGLAVAALLPMWDMVNLAVFNASMVAMDYVLVITFLPCAVIIAEKHFDPMWKRFKNKAGRLEQRWDIVFAPRHGEKRCLERFYGGPFTDLILRWRRVLATVCVVVFIATVSISATLIKLDGEELRFLKEDHMENLAKIERELYTAPNNMHMTVKVFVGPTSENAWDLGDARNYLTPLEDNRGANKVEDAWGGGIVHTDSTFDLSKSQEDFVSLCEAVLVRMSATKWVSNSTHVHCFMRDFKRWAIWKGHGFPVAEDQLLTLLMAWRKDPGGWWNATQMAMGEFGLRDWWYPERTNFAVDSATKPTKIVGAWMALNDAPGGDMPDVDKHTPMQDALHGALIEALADIDSARAPIRLKWPFSRFYLDEPRAVPLCHVGRRHCHYSRHGHYPADDRKLAVEFDCRVHIGDYPVRRLSLMILIGWRIGNQACCLIVASAWLWRLCGAHDSLAIRRGRGPSVSGRRSKRWAFLSRRAPSSSSSSLALVLCQFEIFTFSANSCALSLVDCMFFYFGWGGRVTCCTGYSYSECFPLLLFFFFSTQNF